MRLGTLQTRAVAPLAGALGVAVAFSNGDGGRRAVLEATCSDGPTVVDGVEEARPLEYVLRVQSRAACPIECARDPATGAVCGGRGRGACAAGATAAAAACRCAAGHSGPFCAAEAPGGAVEAHVGGCGVGSGAVAPTALLFALAVAAAALGLLRGRPAGVKSCVMRSAGLALALLVFAFSMLLHQLPGGGALAALSAAPLAADGGASSAASAADAAVAAPLLTVEELLYSAVSHRQHVARVEALSKALPSSLAPLTARVQRFIFEAQHPPSCEGRRFIVSRANEHPTTGLGSHIHVATVHLAVALKIGAVMVWSEDAASAYTDADTCGRGPGASNLECFFLPPSNCTLAHARAAGATHSVLSTFNAGIDGGFGMEWGEVPAPLLRLWEGAGLPADANAAKYWFRGQAAAFLMRPNAATAAAFRALRVAPGALLFAAGPAVAPARVQAAAAAFPLPPGTVSLHIRHGDKGQEMKLVGTAAYLRAAAALARLHPMPLAGRNLFLSTEDPSAVTEAADLLASELHAWALAWYDVPRANSNGPLQLAQLGVPRGQLTRVWLLQLLLALECDAWVGTRGSNWNRLIDELRCVWVPKCQQLFAEVGEDASWEGYGY